jgi:hypothetical protein
MQEKVPGMFLTPFLFAATYSLDQIKDAARHAQTGTRGGKIVLRIGVK